MADDVQIADTSSGDAPHDYTVPSSADFILKAAYGVFDGTLASGNFLPAIEIVSDSGHTVARSVGQQVTAGDSAEVSWFPFAPPASSGGGGGITEIESTDGSITVTNPTGPTVDLTGAGGGGGITAQVEQVATSFVAIANNATGFLTWSHSSGAALLDYTNSVQPVAVSAGTFAFTGTVVSSSTVNAGGWVLAQLAFVTSNGNVSFESVFTGPTSGTVGAIIALSGLVPMSGTDYVRVFVENKSGVSQSFAFGSMTAVELT